MVAGTQHTAAPDQPRTPQAKKARAKSKPASATATLERPKPAGKAQRPGTPKDAAAREHLARSLELPSDDEDEVDDDEDAPVMQEVDPLAAPAVARERLVTAHRDAVAAFDAQMERVCGADALAAAAAGLAPAAQDTEQPLARELLEIPVAMLQPETQHAGGALYGRVLESVVVLSAVTGLLEDEGGDVVRFSVKLGAALGIEAGEGPEGMAAAVAAARRRFAAGQRIAIRDPVYRTSKDGAATVRAEDAATVHFLPRLPFEGLHTEEALGVRTCSHACLRGSRRSRCCGLERVLACAGASGGAHGGRKRDCSERGARPRSALRRRRRRRRALLHARRQPLRRAQRPAEHAVLRGGGHARGGPHRSRARVPRGQWRPP